MQGIKNSKGFTLVEMIIAIGMFAIVSVIILQLFITAKNLNQKANDLDKGILASTSMIELLKSAQKPSDIMNEGFVEYAVIDESKGITNINMYYDDKWNLVDEKDINVSFILTAIIEPTTPIDLNSSNASQAYAIKVSIIKEKPYPMEKNFKKEVYSVETTRYFD